MSQSMESFDANNLAVLSVKSMSPYVPGEQPDTTGWVKLNTNENPYPASPRVVEAITERISGLAKYPSPNSAPLRECAADLYGLEPENVIVGNGSDDLLNLLVRAFAGSIPVGSVDPGYSLYPVLAAIAGARIDYVQLGEGMEVDSDAVKASPANLFFLTSPNAPTGVGVKNAVIESILETYKGILVVDEAYADFAEETALSLIGKFPNLVVTRTLSKSYSLAGLRVGFAFGHASVIAVLDKVRDSYNVDALAQAGAQAALEDQAHFRENTDRILATRSQAYSVFEAKGWFTYPSQANFLFTRPVDASGNTGPEVARSLFEFLHENKVLVRYFPKSSLTDAFLRISIGTEGEMSRLFEIIDQWLNNA